MSGEASDLARLDDLCLELFADDLLVTRWIKLAREHIPIEALPARICYLGFGQRKKFGLAVNELIRKGEVKGPVAFSRDNLDSGSIVNPTFESENMADGGDLISDWPVLNGLLNACGMCDLIAGQANYSMGEAVHTGVTMIADGTEEADLRLVGRPHGRLRHRRRPSRPGRLPGGQGRGQRRGRAHRRGHQGPAVVDADGDLRPAGASRA